MAGGNKRRCGVRGLGSSAGAPSTSTVLFLQAQAFAELLEQSSDMAHKVAHPLHS
jgi:CRP-like cAMP-binding protein